MATITAAKARKLVQAIRGDLTDLERNLQEFHALQAWLPLGYRTFLEFWDAELHKLPIAAGLRNWVIYAMVDEQSVPGSDGKPRLPVGKTALIAQATGVSSSHVRQLKVHQLKARARTRKSGHDDDDMVTVGFVAPYRWRRRLTEVAVAKNVNVSDLMRRFVAEGMRKHYKVDMDAPSWTGREADGHRD